MQYLHGRGPRLLARLLELRGKRGGVESVRVIRPLFRRAAAIGLTVAICSPAMAQTSDPTAARISPYAGEQARTIMSLSEEDLAELRRGGGWGLARAAELHGVPGPKHLLELADEIPLRAEQVEAIQTIFEQMRADAILAGRRFIEAEAALDDAFRRGSVDHDSLRALLDEVAARRSELRRVHLAAHLDTRPILSAEQIERYKRLRGYSDDACDRVPDVHDPAMWRRHHGCE